jgi:hypothetical protein
MKNIMYKSFLIFVLIFLTGCSNLQTTTPYPTTVQPTDISKATQMANPYPVPPTQVVAAYPVPPTDVAKANPLPKKIEIPNPKDDNGVVIGYMMVQGENKPYAGILYLGGMVYADNPDAPPMVGFSVETSPKADMDQVGRFVFKDVKPGDYGLVLWNPVSFFLLNEPNTEKSIKVVVKKGEVIDLGTVYVK